MSTETNLVNEAMVDMVQMTCGHWRPKAHPVIADGTCPTCSQPSTIVGPWIPISIFANGGAAQPSTRQVAPYYVVAHRPRSSFVVPTVTPTTEVTPDLPKANTTDDRPDRRIEFEELSGGAHMLRVSDDKGQEIVSGVGEPVDALLEVFPYVVPPGTEGL